MSSIRKRNQVLDGMVDLVNYPAGRFRTALPNVVRYFISTLRAKADLPFGLLIGFGQSEDLFPATICDGF